MSIIEPLAIKESLERWYLIGNDHKNNNAELTVAVKRVPMEETSRFGIFEVNEDSKIISFE